MTLTNEQIQRIQKLLEWFVNTSETRKRLLEYRKRKLEENHKWIQPDVIQKMSDEELEKKFLDYYKEGGGRQNLNQIYRDRIIRDKKRFRETLLYLLDESIDIKKRLDDILNKKSKYHIEGFGKAITTSFLMDYKPEKYCIWNNKTEMGFSALGIQPFENESFGTAYLKVLEKLKELINLKPELNLDFIEIDLFLHTISAEEEGKKAVDEIINSEHISELNIEDVEQPSLENRNIEFVMEKYLEEFIASNFNKINFGAKLELYQDEENTGRQYPTSVGYIDLLAVDKDKKEFVVIELKKGRSSDMVVGQLLRYIGWVKKHLTINDYKNYNVRGLIIAKEKDDKLEYSLEALRNIESLRNIISVFLYKIDFKLEKMC